MMHNLRGMRPARRVVTGLLSSAAMTCGAAGVALADYPGANWNVTFVEINVESSLNDDVDRDAVMATVRSGLRKANDVYFYGDMPVRMKVSVRRGDASVVDVEVIDGLSGAVLAETRGLSLEDDALADRALAWMDGLECASTSCTNSSVTAVSVAPPADADAEQVAAAQNDLPVGARQVVETVLSSAKTTTTPVQNHASGVEVEASAHLAAVVPVPRPTAMTGSDLVGTSVGRAIPNLPATAAPSVRLARFDTTGLGNITYGTVDRLVLSDAAPRAVERPISSSRRANPGKDTTVIGQMFDSFVSLIGLQEEPQPRAVADSQSSRISAATRSSTTPDQSEIDTRLTGKRLSVRDAIAGADAPFRPSARWTQVPVPGSEPSVARAERIASLSGLGSAAAPAYSGDADAQVSYSSPDNASSTSPIFRATQGQSGDQTTEPFVTSRIVNSTTVPGDNLSIRLHPELFGRFSLERFASFVPVYPQRQPAPTRETNTRVAALAQRAEQASPSTAETPSPQGQVRTGAQPEAPAPTTPKSVKEALDDALAERGLALDEEVYSKTLRVAWDGADRSDRFVLTLPQLVGFKYAMITTEDRTLVARVESVPGPVRLSAAIATSLGLRQDEWADVKVVALREIERVASTETLGQVFTSARIALPQD